MSRLAVPLQVLAAHVAYGPGFSEAASLDSAFDAATGWPAITAINTDAQARVSADQPSPAAEEDESPAPASESDETDGGQTGTSGAEIESRGPATDPIELRTANALSSDGGHQHQLSGSAVNQTQGGEAADTDDDPAGTNDTPDTDDTADTEDPADTTDPADTDDAADTDDTDDAADTDDTDDAADTDDTDDAADTDDTDSMAFNKFDGNVAAWDQGQDGGDSMHIDITTPHASSDLISSAADSCATGVAPYSAATEGLLL